MPLSATQFSDIEATTLKEILPKAVEDSYFLATPLQRYVLDHCSVPWEGGAFNQDQFLLRGTNGGAFAKGDNFDTAEENFIDEKIFTIKTYYENITVDLIDSEIFNRGPLAVLDLTDIQMQAAVITQSARLAVDMSLHGQANASGIVGMLPAAEVQPAPDPQVKSIILPDGTTVRLNNREQLRVKTLKKFSVPNSRAGYLLEITADPGPPA